MGGGSRPLPTAIKQLKGTHQACRDAPDAPPVNSCRPSADVTMQSAAAVYGRRTIGVIMTGMGKDGAAGMLAIKRVEGRTLAQDRETSVIYGMPRAAIDAGAVDHVVPLDELARRLRFM